jgi:NAD(P)H-hydrate epimerase
MGADEILSVAEHAEADRLAAAAGVSGEALMEAAGAGIAAEIVRRWIRRPVTVLCGPGNNGGDGFVIARILHEEGWPVRLAVLGEAASLSGDAALMAARWTSPVEPMSPAVVGSAELVVDALFGAGLGRPLSGVAAETIQAVADSGVPAVAVDLPSGVFGDTGAVGKAVAPAVLTVTFFRRKPAHLLFPARGLCGEVVVIDIGTPAVLDDIAPLAWRNEPVLWAGAFPWPGPETHKYRRGHDVVVSGGAATTGAARLAAAGAARAGAGLVTIGCPREALPIVAPAVTEILAAPVDGPAELFDLLAERKRNAVLIGPANGVTDGTRANVNAVLDAPVAAVLDADALTVFAEAPEELFEAVDETCVLTPHDGEFDRLFPHVPDTGRLGRARAAADASGAVVLLKGPDTVVAHPDGRAAISDNAPPHLATAGSGDVLGGILVGLRAQGMPPFEAAAAAAWLLGEAAARFGLGLIASDLPGLLPPLLGELAQRRT